MELQYRITFLSDWHCGSGLSGGAETDNAVLKDNDNLPYVPGKTMKGLVRDALLEMNEVQPENYNIQEINQLLGSGEAGSETTRGEAYFSNAALPDLERRELTPELSAHLYRNLASTQIAASGVAEGKSLRVMEVCIPVFLEGTVSDVADRHQALLADAFKWIRHLGVNRNRGLGRCKIELTDNQN